MTREDKLNNLVQLLSGKIKPDDLKPKRLCMAIGYSAEPIYSINEKEVSKEEYYKWAHVDPKDYGTGVFHVTYGDSKTDKGGSHE